MIFTAFQRLVDFNDCPGSRKSPLLLTMPVNWCVAAASLQQVWASEESSMPMSGWSQEKWLMRICSLTHSDWRKRAAWGLAIPEMEREGLGGGCFSYVLSAPWRQEKLNDGWKSIARCSDFEKLAEKVDNKAFKATLKEVFWQKGHPLVRRMCSTWLFLGRKSFL